MAYADSPDVQQRMARIETLIQALNDVADPTAQAHARELVQAVLDLHGAGLERMLDLVYDAAGQTLIDALGRDELVGSVLLVHGLHPFSLTARVEQALNAVRPYLGSHGGYVRLLSVTPEGGVRLRLEGSCHGCPSSRVTLEHAIEEAIYQTAPDVTELHVEGAVESQPAPAFDGFIPMADVAGQNGQEHRSG